MKPLSLLGLCTAWAIALASAASSTHAELIAYDSFTYDISANTNLGTRDGGTGWTSQWTTNTPTGGITPLTLTQMGTPLAAGYVKGGSMAVSMPGGSGGPSGTVAGYRTFAPQTGEVWFSFLLRTPNSVGGDDFLQFSLNNDSTQNNSGSIGDTDTTTTAAGAKFSVRIGTASSGGTTVPGPNPNADIVGNTDYLLIGRMSKDGAASTTNYDLIEMWVNPFDLSVPETASFIVSSDANSGFSSFNHFTVRTANFSGTPYYFDELRIGTSYSDVLPEPSSLSLITLAAMGLLRRRR